MDTDVSHEVEKRLDAIEERVSALEGPSEEVSEEEPEETEEPEVEDDA